MRKHYIKNEEIPVYKRGGVTIFYDKPYVMLPGNESNGKPNGVNERKPRKQVTMEDVSSVLKEHKEHPDLSDNTFARRFASMFDFSPSTIMRIIEGKTAIQRKQIQ